ncbi:MAG: hypothetical protein JWQ87_2230 [Candidatus Sulfotelmatobacter sp.]|nr:hypothetical protein [Candidatus Sulfotelmatobacter sp.]
MKRKILLCLPTLCLLLTSGCAPLHRSVEAPRGSVDMVVARDCLLSDVRLIGCNTRQSPPSCKSAKFKYRNGCEALVIRK